LLLDEKDFEQEYRLLKLVTEDEIHKSNYVRISKQEILSNNRYKDILPCKFFIKSR